MKKRNKHILSVCIMLSITLTTTIAQASELKNDDVIEPKKASYGYYVDVYKNNNSDNLSVNTNPSIALLSQFLNLWEPGTTRNNGEKLNSTILDENINSTKNITSLRSKIDEKNAYLDDRRNQSYSTISGLGPYSNEFINGSNAGTTIPDEIPSDASITLYNDKGNNVGVWADEESKYGAIVKLVNTLHGEGTSTSSAKKFYKYMRPFRWSDEVEVESMLKPAIKKDPNSDGGYPSGHTNSSYLAAYALAYAVPERYDELITRASELGNNRIVCGMHSCMDVMGGRVLSTALAASILNNPENNELKKQAIDAGKTLISQSTTNKDDYSDYTKNKKKYIERLTYGFKQIGDTNKPMIVPKGAEVLLESRFPYLDAKERRYVLYTTGLPSGYPILDDEEGWGRLNLFEASNGYSSFVDDVNIDMDESKGGFNAEDEWKNNIDGDGSLTKNGTGKLTLSGDNSYNGGTNVNGGILDVKSAKALGNGSVVNNSKLEDNHEGDININGSYTQDENAVLELNISSTDDVLKILGEANLKGKLIVNFNNGFVPKDTINLVTYSESSNTSFSNVEINGLPKDYNKEITYTSSGIKLAPQSKINSNENDNINGNSNNNKNSSDTLDLNVVPSGSNNPINTDNIYDGDNNDKLETNTAKTGDNNVLIVYIIFVMVLSAYSIRSLTKKHI